MQVVYANLIPLLWLCWLVYWFIAARSAKKTVRSESAASLAGHLVPLVIAAWLLWGRPLPTSFLGGKLVPPGATVWLIGVVAVAAGLAFSVWARLWLGRNWSGVVTVKQGHELVRGGPYRYVRHPIYTGILLAFAGTAIARDEWRGVIAVAIAWFALWRKLRVEESWMVDRFGDAYRRFQAEVPALIPNPFRRGAAAGAP